jgi:NAD(P)-dependent dehydrogenase (short-subunit alcohol dehydrogenase family)
MKTFENKTVLITGGASGIGKATAIAFGKEGANVVVSGRRVAEGEQVAREITSAGGSALYVQADVGREDDIVALVEKTVGAFGALHVAFNNAGTEGQFGLLITEQTVEHYHQVCDVNIRGVLLLMKHEIPVMLRSGGGAIVNNSCALAQFTRRCVHHGPGHHRRRRLHRTIAGRRPPLHGIERPGGQDSGHGLNTTSIYQTQIYIIDSGDE